MITVFGSINLDLVVAVPRLPQAGETVSGADHQTFAGGKGANQALAARRAGADVRMVGAVGQDTFSGLSLANLKQAGVDVSTVRSLDCATGLALVGVDAAGENQIIVASGANVHVDANWLNGTLKGDDMLMLQGEVPFQETSNAMQLARQTGCSVFWNPAPVSAAIDRTSLDQVTTLVVNEGEALEIATGLGILGDPEKFVAALVHQVRDVVVTLGPKGVIAGRGSQLLHLEAPSIEAIDTTGAGDAFCGALAAALDRKIPFERAVKEGVAAGALACTSTGAQSSAPAKADIERLADQIV